MSKMIQIRNVPDPMHGILKARAALQGKSLSDYILDELRRLSEVPTPQELADRIAKRTPLRSRMSPTRLLREERDRR